MPQNDISIDHRTYRADCKDCEKYVGPPRRLEEEADADMLAHKRVIGNEDCNVEIEVTQSN